MKVIVDDNVVKAIDDFYIAAMSRHISLSEETVMAKKKRLIASLESLKDYYFKGRLRFPHRHPPPPRRIGLVESPCWRRRS